MRRAACVTALPPLALPPLDLRDSDWPLYRDQINALRPAWAARHGIVPFERQGGMALAVGLSHDDDQRVIKLVRWGDPFLVYARLLRAGAYADNPAAMAIHDLRRVDAAVWRVKMERLMPPPDPRRVYRLGEAIMNHLRWNPWRQRPPFLDPAHAPLWSIARDLACRGYGFSLDMAQGNILARADGTLVLVDPLA